MLSQFGDDVFVVEQPQRFLGVELGTRMTILRFGNDLLLHSPVAATPSLRAALAELGRICWVVAPNRFHHLYCSDWLGPDVTLVGAPGLAQKRSALPWNGVLGEANLPVQTLTFRSLPMVSETVFHHHPSRSLIVSDLLFNIPKRAPFSTRVAMTMVGAPPGVRSTLLERVFMERKTARQELAQVLAWDFDRIILAHGDLVVENGCRPEWGDATGFNDAEAVTFVDFNEQDTVYVLEEDGPRLGKWDFSMGDDQAVLLQRWDLTTLGIPSDGAEGLTFVPDDFLQAQGFTDEAGNPTTSQLGMGGLMFVGHQEGGPIYVLDLAPDADQVNLVGRYETAAEETAGLEFDRSTGLLYIWHGGDDLFLEVTQLSSTAVGAGRALDTVKSYRGPGKPTSSMTDNLEGFAVVSNEDCQNQQRDAFITVDGGRQWSLMNYQQFPCE